MTDEQHDQHEHDEQQQPSSSDTIVFPYELDPFQRTAIDHIQSDEHVLVTAHTSAGKSTVAEFGVNWCLKKGVRILYTAPIKALSNQKYADFRKKAASGMFDCSPDDIGIVTGDVQHNPDGKVIIATTEIVHNYLYSNSAYFDDVGIVVFDEVHYINDPDRGKVWEGSIVMMPAHIVMVMLSATIPKADQFADWIRRVKAPRRVGVVSTEYRPVPLTHSLFWNNEFHVICDAKTTMLETYERVRRDILEVHKPAASHASASAAAAAARTAARKAGEPVPPLQKIRKPPSEAHLLNQVVRKLEEADKLPGFFFCFSRKKCHTYAHSVQHPVSDGKTLTNGVHRYQSLVRQHVHPNDHALPQILEMERLIGKGVAVHHSGLLPVLKEIVEKLFEEKFVQVLFVTETFAVGINLATRCVVLTDVRKHDGTERRTLEAHEYQQIAGRAGRRGLDTAGMVVLLPLQPVLPTIEAFRMISGAKRPIRSRFELDAPFLLAAMQSDTQTISRVLLSTLMATEVTQHAAAFKTLLDKEPRVRNDETTTSAAPNDPLAAEYLQLCATVNQPHKQSKSKRRAINALDAFCERVDATQIAKWNASASSKQRIAEQQQRLHHMELESTRLDTYLMHETQHLLDYLAETKYVIPHVKCTEGAGGSIGSEAYFAQIDTWGGDALTVKGKVCTLFHECPAVLTTEWLLQGKSDHLSGEELVMVLASLVDERPSASWTVDASLVPRAVQAAVDDLYTMHESLARQHAQQRIPYPRNEVVLYMTEYAALWLAGTLSVADILARATVGIDSGNFVKCMLKVYNMHEELKKAYALLGHPNESKLVGIAPRLLRDTVRVDSLYY
jgi:superfamily II RNA helicase